MKAYVVAAETIHDAAMFDRPEYEHARQRLQ
jgi:hypothetical protein